MGSLEAAQLLDESGALVATVEVPAFPNTAGIIGWEGRYFANGSIGYETAGLFYTETSFYEVPPAKPEEGPP